MAYEQYLKIDTAIVNPMARKVLGTGILARLLTLHAAAGVKSACNIFVQHCAELLDSSLRAVMSTIQERLLPWTADICGVQGWSVNETFFAPASPYSPASFSSPFTMKMSLRPGASVC